MSATQETYRGYSDPALAGHRSRFVIHPEHSVPTARLAPGHVARALAVTGAISLARALVLVAMVVLWVWLLVNLFTVAQDEVDLTTYNLTTIAGFGGLAAVFAGLGRLRRWVVDRLPTVPADPTGPYAVEVEHEVSGLHRELITTLRARAQRGRGGAELCDQHTCLTARWLLWDLASAARAHRRLTLDTVARPSLTVPRDPRSEVLTDLAAQIDYVAAVLDVGLVGDQPCMCRTTVANSELIELTARAAALTRRRTASEVTW